MLNAQSLKTVIAINIALSLLIAFILIDFVFVSTSQKDYINKKKKDNHALVLSVQNALRSGNPEDIPSPSPAAELYLKELAGINDITSMVIIGSKGFPIFSYDDSPDEKFSRALADEALQTIRSGKATAYLYGKTWGVFFIRNRYLVICSPIRIGADGAIKAAVGSAVNLAPFYALQRKNQLIIFFYALINILILMALGTYAISRAAIRPINALVKRAEEHQEQDNLGFFHPRGRNEFRRLSTSLNRMLDRIDKDKHRLEDSLVSLEEANREIKNRQNELIRAEKLASVGRLSAGIAHEIGNPIGIVLGYLDILSHPDLTEMEKKDYITRCRNEINKINIIIRDLLDFSRASGKEAMEKVSVHVLIKETMDLLAIQPAMRNVNKKYELNASNDNVVAVPDKLRQVFVNLILNAADAISTSLSGEGEIVIRSSTVAGNTGKGDTLCIDISDNGAGIKEADLEIIFDPFYTTKEPGQGTGLGLYVCYMIIDNMGGSISVASRQGKGATFSVHLPLFNKS